MGEIILITKRMRMDWIDAIAFDLEVSRAALRAACIIGRHFNHTSGETFLRLDTIAKGAGVSERTAWTSVQELEKRGYLIVIRQEHGGRVSDGRKVAGGRGRANVYRPAFKRDVLTATDRGQKLATHCDLLLSKARNPLRPSIVESSQKRVIKVATHCDPTLKKDIYPIAESKIDDGAWPKVRRRVTEQIGVDQADTWLSNVGLHGIADGIVTLTAPTRFLRDSIERRFNAELLQAWQEHDHNITAVRIEHRRSVGTVAPTRERVA